MVIKKEEVVSLVLSRANKLMNEKELTLERLYHYAFEQHQHNIAFEYVNEKNKYCKISYGKANKNIKKYASTISNLIDINKRHSVVVLRLNNSPTWCQLFYALLMAGFKPLLVNPKTNVDGVNNLISQTKAVAVITDDPFTYHVKKIHIDDILCAKEDYTFVPCWEDEVIFCSSGTTGDVKLMVFNGENLCYQLAECLDMPYETKDIMYPKKYGKVKMLAMIPFFHIFGFVAIFLWYPHYGSTIVFPPSINSREIQELCAKHGITHIYTVPLFWDSVALQFDRQLELAEEPVKTYLNNLLKMNLEGGHKLNKIIVKKIQEKLLGSNIRMCITGGGYLSEHTSRIINGIGYPLYNGFGMTEIGVTSVELSPLLSQRLKCSVGKPLHGVEYKIENNQNRGELLVKSKAIHSKEIIGGVIKESNLDSEGFFHTGDIAEVDDDGYYYIKGRIKDVIINADGENIFPDEIELYFRNIEGISNFTVVGAKTNPKSNREDLCIVVEIPSSSFSPEILEKLRNAIKLAAKDLPRGIRLDKIFFTSVKLPLANNIKVKRHLVKESIESGSDDFVEYKSNDSTKNQVVFDEATIENILKPVKKIYSEVLLLPESKINNDSHWINDLGGDSMNYFELISKVNERFSITIPDEDYTSLACINDMVEEIIKLKK